MELKAGYKQTEVGVIPDDWKVSTLEELTDKKRPISYGIVQTGPHVPMGVKCLRVVDIEEGIINASNLITTSKEISDNYKRTILKTGDLIMPLRGKVGDVAIVNESLTGCNLTRGIALISIRDEWSALYFKQFISSLATRIRLENSMNGSALQEIPIATLRTFKVAFPPTKSEQQAIATALSDVDVIIESLDRLIAKKYDVKQAAMQELLRPKDSWIIRRLGDIATIKTGSRNNQDKTEDGKYPFFVRSATIERINCYSYDCEAILVPGEGGIGSIFHYIIGRFDVHQRVYAITEFTQETYGKYVYFYMTQKFGAHAMRNSVKATVDSLRLPTFENFEILIPSTYEEQRSIATALSDMDAEISVLEKKRDKTKLLKQGMMQELLTGRIRLI